MNGSTMQITLEQVYERLQEFRDQSQKEIKELRQDMDSKFVAIDKKFAAIDDKFTSMRAWVISLFIGTLVLTSAMVGVFINAVMILLQQTAT